MRPISLLCLTLLTGAFGCSEHEFDPPDQEERRAAAAAAFDAAMFDTIGWASDSLRAVQGNIVYATKCRNCHGVLGEGETEYAMERGLEVSSLVEPGWALADDAAEVRRLVFVGHSGGMPTWGVAGISPREIDASVHYILNVLRPEVLGNDGGN